MNTFQDFPKDIRLATAGLEPEAIARELAAFARRELASVIASGEGSKAHLRFVNGRQGAAEETVTIPGQIVYVFAHWSEVIPAAIRELVKRSPRKSGRYAASYIAIAGGRIVQDYDAIPAAAEVIIVNYQPYTRQLDAAGGLKKGRRHFELAAQAMNRGRFGNSFVTNHTYLRMPAGIHPSIPYVLKAGARLRRAKQNDRSSAFRDGRTHLVRRKELDAGQPITYPALILNVIGGL